MRKFLLGFLLAVLFACPVLADPCVPVTSVELIPYDDVGDPWVFGKMLDYFFDVIILPGNATNKNYSLELYDPYDQIDRTGWLHIVEQEEDYVILYFEATGDYLLTIRTEDGPFKSYEIFVGNK